MASQPTALGKLTSTYPIQLHLLGSAARGTVNIPVSSANPVSVMVLPSQKGVNCQQPIKQPNGSQPTDMKSLDLSTSSGDKANNLRLLTPVSAPKPDQIKNKILETVVSNPLQFSGGHLQLMPSSGGGGGDSTPSSLTASAVQVRNSAGNSYFFQPTTTTVSADSVISTVGNLTTSQIVLKKSVAQGNLQIIQPFVGKSTISNKAVSINKCQPIAPKMAQPLVIKNTSKISPALISKKVILPNEYINNISSGQITNRKIILTQKLPNEKLKPVVNATGTNIIKPPQVKLQANNFQLTNTQLLNDVQGNMAFLTTVPPLQPLTMSATPTNSTMSNAINHMPKKDMSSEGIYPTSIPGTRVEPISEKEYSISIPEMDASIGEDAYTVSLSAANDENKSFTIPIPEKGKSLICKNTNALDPNLFFDIDNATTVTSVPAILRRSNSDNNDKKAAMNKRRISMCGNIDTKTLEDITRLSERMKMSKLNRLSSSLYCDEEMESEIDMKTSKVPLSSIEIMTKNNVTITPQSVPVSKGRRKNRVSSDVKPYKTNTFKHLQNNHDQDFSNNASSKHNDKSTDHDGLERVPGLQWDNGVFILNGSNLKFNVDEFGLLDVVGNNNSNPVNFIENIPRHGEGKKSPNAFKLYRCMECECFGMPTEFINSNFCSIKCQEAFQKNSKLIRMKNKAKQKKILMKKTAACIKEQQQIAAAAAANKETQHDHQVKMAKSSRDVVADDKSTNGDGAAARPWICSKSGFSWMKYLEYCRATAAPEKFFKDGPAKNGFKKGMKLEAVDPMRQSLFAVVTVANTQGHRLKLHFDGYDDDYDFWVNADSCDIFPAGWCEKNKRTLRPPAGYDENSFSWSSYLKQSKAIVAPKCLFGHLSESLISAHSFRVGMKLEAEDRKNSLTCVATVKDVINNRILIQFDSWDDIYDFWVDPTSPYIHPVGWCDENGISLTPPNTYHDPEKFSWENYLVRTKAVPVPSRAFKPRPPNKFKIGMKLEAVDKRVPFLVRVVTINDVTRHQVKIFFDGWTDDLSYWVDDDSPDIHPVGWCLKTGHSLEPPLTAEDMVVAGECGIRGCRGLGNSSGSKLTTHWTPNECPYRIPAVSPIQRDRLEGIRPPPEHTEPRTREPRKGSTLQVTPPKRKLEDEEDKLQIKVMEEEFKVETKRKRTLSPKLKKRIMNSVYEPGYLPNPNYLKPPYWAGNFNVVSRIISVDSFSTDPRNWSEFDVQQFVERLTETKEYTTMFAKHRIHGLPFLMLAQDDLVTILKVKLGHALKIYNAILCLRDKVLS